MNMKRLLVLAMLVLLLCLPMWAMAHEHNLAQPYDDGLTINSGDVLYGKQEDEYLTVTVNGSGNATVTLRDVSVSDGFLLLKPCEGVKSITVFLEGENQLVQQGRTNDFSPFHVLSDCIIKTEKNGILNCIMNDEESSGSGIAINIDGSLMVESGTISAASNVVGIVVIGDLNIRGGSVSIKGQMLGALLVGDASVSGGTFKLESDGLLIANAETGATVVPNIEPSLDIISDTPTKLEVTDEHDWGDEYISNGNGTHAQLCNRDSSHKSADIPCSGGMATTTQLAVCEYCGAEYGELLPVPPQTGDNSNIILWAVLACMSMLGMMTPIHKRKEA